MAITTLDGVLAGATRAYHFHKLMPAATRLISTWSLTGLPPAGGYSGAGLNGTTYSSSGGQITGAIPHFNPGGGLASYLARLVALSYEVAGGTVGFLTVILADRLWDNSGITITSTTAQTIVSPTWPARDAAGGTNGVGVLLAVEVSATVGSASPTITISYTNSSGVAGRTGTNIGATAVSGTGITYLIGLQPGDVGVQSVQSLTLSVSWLSGTINLVAFRPIAMLGTTTAIAVLDCLSSGFPRIWDGGVMYLMTQCSQLTDQMMITGTYTETQG